MGGSGNGNGRGGMQFMGLFSCCCLLKGLLTVENVQLFLLEAAAIAVTAAAAATMPVQVIVMTM